MKIVALSTCEFHGGYVLRRVHSECPIAHVLRVQPQPAPSNLKKKLRSLITGKFLSAVEQRIFYRKYFERQERLIHQQLDQEVCEQPLPPTLEIPSRQINSPETVALLRELAPDILLVCSAPILKPAIFTIPKIATINVHFGWSPDYRGENTLFWPLYRRDYTKLGVTVHRIDIGIDTGALLAQGSVELSPLDSEITLWAKGIELSAELVLDVLSRAASGPIPGLVQTARGRNYNFRSRRAWHDTWLFIRRKLLRERLPVLPEQRWCMTDGNISRKPIMDEQNAAQLDR